MQLICFSSVRQEAVCSQGCLLTATVDYVASPGTLKSVFFFSLPAHYVALTDISPTTGRWLQHTLTRPRTSHHSKQPSTGFKCGRKDRARVNHRPQLPICSHPSKYCSQPSHLTWTTHKRRQHVIRVVRAASHHTNLAHQQLEKVKKRIFTVVLDLTLPSTVSSQPTKPHTYMQCDDFREGLMHRRYLTP